MRRLVARAGVRVLFVLCVLVAFSFPATVRAEHPEVALATPDQKEVVKEGLDPAELQLVAEPAEVAAPGLLAGSTANYAFATNQTGSLVDMSSGTTQLLAANLDDNASALTNIGFEFVFQGTRYGQFSANTNGVIRLGAVAQTAGPYHPLAQANIPIITAIGSDQRTHVTGKVHYKVIGVAPSRELVIEWLNMQSNFNSGGTADYTYQVHMYESTGVIEFVYGSMTMSVSGAGSTNSKDPHIGFSSSNLANTVGSVTAPQTPPPDPTYNGASAVPVNNLYVAGPITTLTSAADGSRRVFTFTPPLPDGSPSNLTFSGTTALTTTLNWTDNSSNEQAFLVYRSNDGGVTYNFLAQTAANVTTYADSGLTPNTTYFYEVFGATEGAVSSPVTASVTTAPPGVIQSTSVGGPWSAPATWVGNTVPTSADNVTIDASALVTIDTAAVALSLTIAGSLEFDNVSARTLTVGNDVTIQSGGAFRSAAAGTIVNHTLSLGGNLINNGILDFSTNGNTAGANITFTGAANTTFQGNGPTTDILSITVNKGNSSASIVELIAATDFTVRGVNTDVAGFLTLTNGTFKISGNFTVTNRVFTTATYTIPATAGIWLNNPNFTVAATASAAATSNNGLWRVTQGTYNIGIGAGDQMRGGAGATFIIEGGTVNCSGAFDPQSAVTYVQSGGTLNVGVVGNNVSNFGTFELFSGTSSFTMSGGTINVVNRNSNATTPVDFRVLSTTFNVTGGLVVFGAGAAPAGTTYIHLAGLLPSFTVNPTMTLNFNNATAVLRGTTVTNNGSIVSTGTSARFDFGGAAAMTYTGSGSMGTAASPFPAISANSTSLTTLNAPVYANRINLFQGGFINSNQITLGNGGTSATVVQVGSTGLTTPGGSFDVSPFHNQGTGGETVLYQSETAPRTTGFEINPTRALVSMTVDNANNVTVAGGDLTLTSNAAALTLTNGRVITGANTVALVVDSATVTRTNGYVVGNLRKNLSASASNKTFEVGTANGYAPVAINATAGLPADMTVSSTQATAPGLPPATSLTRYWTLTVPSGVTADLTFNYLAGDVPGSANESNFKLLRRDGGAYTDVLGSVNPATHQATVSGMSQFSDWTLAESAVAGPTATVSGDATICAGGSANVSVVLTGTPPWSITWQDAVIESGIVVTPHVRSVSPAGTTAYSVLAMSDSIGAGTASGSATITVNPIPPTPTASAGGNTTFCQGGSVTLSSDSASGNQWYRNGTLIGGAAGQQYVANQSGSYTVVVTSLGCSSAASNAVSVTVNPLPATPTINAGGPTTFCTGGSVTLTSSSASGNQWYLNGNPIGGETNQTYNANASGSYTVVVTDGNGCVSAPSAPTVVTVNPIPPTPTINAGGATTFCQGGSVTLTSSAASGNQWYRDGSAIGGAVNQTFNATQSGSYTVVATVNGCASASSAATVVTVNPIPPQPTISAGGATTFCAGGSVTLTSSSATGNQWYRNGTLLSGEINQTYNATTSGSYTVIVTALGCSSPASAATVVTVNPIPPTPTISAGGPTTFCEGGSVTLTSSATSGNQWYRDGTLIVGATTRTYSATVGGNYTVIVTLLGCSSAASSQTTVTVNPKPATPVVSATASVPVGATGITASVANHAGAAYAWTVTGGTITGGQGTSTITYDAGVAGTVMTLSVTETSSAGCTSLAGSTRQVVDFLDVPPSHPFHNFVVKIARAGITAGCGGGNFCPDSSVSRAQMAVFLLIGKHGNGYTPPPAVGIFADVPVGSFAANFIEELYNEGITGGCSSNPLKYCPNDAVTRAQMAVFLLIAEHGAGYTPPPATGIFQDVPPGSFARNFIEQLYNEGITGGCSSNPLLYCPTSSTSRGQMSVFLSVTFALP